MGGSPLWGHGLLKQIATKLQQLPQNALSTKSRLQAFQLTMAGDRRWKAWLKWQGIAKSPQNHLMSTKASFAWLPYRIHSNFDKMILNGLGARDHVCSHLGAVHLGTPGVGIVDGSLALARRLIDFFDLPISIPCATQWKWFSRGWPMAYRMGPMPNESKSPMLYQISGCVQCMCVSC